MSFAVLCLSIVCGLLIWRVRRLEQIVEDELRRRQGRGGATLTPRAQ